MEQMVCPHCGALISADNQYCGSCGAPVQAADALLSYASREPAGEDMTDATRIWKPAERSRQQPRPDQTGAELPPEPGNHGPVRPEGSPKPMELESEQSFAAPSGSGQPPRKTQQPLPELPRRESDEQTARPGFFRTRAGKIIMILLIVAAGAGLIAGAIAITKGIVGHSGKNTDVGQPAAADTSPEDGPASPEQEAERGLLRFFNEELIPELGVVPAVNAAPQTGGADIDPRGISGLLLAELHDYLGEGVPQLLTVSTGRVRMDAPAWDDGAASYETDGLELRLYRYEADAVRLYASCTVDGFSPGVRDGRTQPLLELSRSDSGNLYLHFSDCLYGTDSRAEVYRALEVDYDGIRVVFNAAVTAAQREDAAAFESLVRKPLRNYDFYLSAQGSMASLDTVPLLRCSRDENTQAGISVFSVKELTGLLTDTGLTDPLPAYSRYEDYLSYLQQRKDRITDYTDSLYYQKPSMVAFADLTGDGRDEMVYVYTESSADAGFAYYEIVTSCGGYIVPLWRGIWQTGYYYPVQERTDHAVAVFRVTEENAVYVLDQTAKGTDSRLTMLKLTPVTDYRLEAENVASSAERNAAMDRGDLLVLYQKDNAPADGGRLFGRLNPGNMSYAKAVSWLEQTIGKLKEESSEDSGGLELFQTELRFTEPGATAVLSVKAADQKDVRWSSSNPAVASVGASGLVTALRPGTAVITASLGGRTAACMVTCDWDGDGEEGSGSDEPLRLLRTDMTFFNPGEFFTLTVLNVPSGTPVSWQSLDPSVATVDANGKVVAVGPGTTKIVARVGERTGECIVRCSINH